MTLRCTLEGELPSEPNVGCATAEMISVKYRNQLQLYSFLRGSNRSPRGEAAAEVPWNNLIKVQFVSNSSMGVWGRDYERVLCMVQVL